MVKKFKILICSTTFLACSAFSAHAMSSDDEIQDYEAPSSAPVAPAAVDEEKIRVYRFCGEYGFNEGFKETVYEAVKGRTNGLNRFGVPHLDYEVASLFYSRHRSPDHMNLLIDLFTKTPVEHREKMWNSFVQWESAESQRHFLSLCDFFYNAKGKLMASRPSPTGVKYLKETLFELPAPERN